MERYSVVVTTTQSTQPLRLLIPYPASAKCASLIEEIVDRAFRFGRSLSLQNNNCALFLGSSDGPVIDSDDVLSDVIRGEQLFASFTAKDATPQAPVKTEPIDAKGSIPICIVTPSIARSFKDSASSPPPAFYLASSDTVGHLHTKAADYLKNTLNQDPLPNNGTFDLDLHTIEAPISTSCFTSTLEKVGFPDLAAKGALTIYAVIRPTPNGAPQVAPRDGYSTPRTGMNDLYTANKHWSPGIMQSERGMCMFLSSLRVFTQLLRGEKMDDVKRDRALYIFDLFTRFPPAVRALHFLVQGRIPEQAACAAMSQAVFFVLGQIVSANLIRDDESRVFEGSRLLFGLVLEKIQHFHLADTRNEIPSYTSLFHIVKLQRPQESQTRPLDLGAPEENASVDDLNNSVLARVAAISDVRTQVIVFRPPKGPVQHPHRLEDIVTQTELENPYHLASLCGKASLSVFKPSNLASVAPPCLTFDKDGHLAVYTGKAGCAEPGRDIVFFRPFHGESTPDIGLVVQQLAPILRGYEADGTNVFDVLGSSKARALDYPDEILMFAVDCSSSMDTATDFLRDKAKDRPKAGANKPDLPYDQDTYDQTTLEDTLNFLADHEIFADILGSVSESPPHYKIATSRKMLTFLSSVTAIELERLQYPFVDGFQLEEMRSFAAGLVRHEQALIDFIVLRAARLGKERWVWQIGDLLPGRRKIPNLPHEITDVPIELRCPISYEILQDPVIAADEHTYSRSAISKWMQIRKSSPLTGLAFVNTELQPNHDLAEKANAWIQSDDILETKTDQPRTRNKRPRTSVHGSITVTFSDCTDIFTRALPTSLSVQQLYKVASRGLKGRHNRFQLLIEGGSEDCLVPSVETVSSAGLEEGSAIRIVVDTSPREIESEDSKLCLIKVYDPEHSENPLFCYWVPRVTEDSFASIMAKYWRYTFSRQVRTEFKKCEIWTGLQDCGDGRMTGTIGASCEELHDYLDTEHAYGTLKHEPVNRVDDNDSEEEDEDFADDDSRPLVLKVWMQKEPEPERHKLTRMDVSKQMFEALINRILAYSYKTHIGLVTFATIAKNSQTLTHVIENFRRSVENMDASGDTCLWNGLRLAKDQIMEYAKKYPLAKRRIICLSDGNDNKSVEQPPNLYWQLRQENIAVDSICIGNDSNHQLKTLSHLLGSYCFSPQDMATALAICELEPVLSQTERPPIVMKSIRGNLVTGFYSSGHSARFTTVTRDVFPARKEHSRMDDSFIQLVDCVRRGTCSTAVRSNLRPSRLLTEMRGIASDPHPKYDCYVSEVDMSFWKIVMEGPPETPYSGSVFLLYLEMPENFPSFPPKGRFVTPIFHPNINRHGRICHSIFDRDWTTDTSLNSVLNTVYGLLFHAEMSDAVHVTVTLGYHHGQDGFAEEARKHARTHAKKTRLEWRAELLGGE